MNKLVNKVVVVTGASRGIGRAIAERYAAEGASVVLAARHLDKIQEAAQWIESKRGRAFAVACDVTQEADVLRLMEETIKRYHRLDILVNNAGVGHQKPLAESTTDEWDTVIDTNMKGVYLCAREGFKHMKLAGGGLILNIASVAGKEAWSGTGVYSASKFGVMALSQALAAEGAPYGIRVSALCPGAVNTDMMQDSGLSPDAMIQPEDVADAVMYLTLLPKNVTMPELVMQRRGAD